MRQRTAAGQGQAAGSGSGRKDGTGQASGGTSAGGFAAQLKRRVTFVRWSDDAHWNFVLSYAVLVVCICAAAENFSSTGYGRFGEGAYVAVSPRLGWWLMELPVTLSFLYFFFVKGGPQSRELAPRVLAGVFCWHYAYRGWVFPYLIRVHGNSSNFSLVPSIFGSMVTVLHGYMSARWFSTYGTHLTRAWLSSAQFRIGLLVYASGFAMTVYHDHILRTLRPLNPEPSAPRYFIPYGGLFDYATCAHYGVELWTFLGFWLLSGGPNGLFILVVSIVNLVPRAAQTTLWYQDKFGDEYPDRAHIIPFVY